jgi:hypothetical protein
MPSAATTGNLEGAQRVMVSAARYTAEHNAPMFNLIEHMTLQRGAKQVTVPKVGVMTMSDLVDGQDIVDEEDIGMTTTDLTASEIGARIVVSDKLVRQSQPAVFSMIGRQLGDAKVRKQETDVQALYQNLNSGTALGQTTKELKVVNLAACIAHAKANKFGNQIYAVHHPNAVHDFIKSSMGTASTQYPIPEGWSQDLLKNFFVGLRPLNGVPLFEAGNIPEDSNEDGIGCIANKDAMVALISVAERTERERDASLRATEIVLTADYGVFELDNSRGAPMKYKVSAPVTNA